MPEYVSETPPPPAPLTTTTTPSPVKKSNTSKGQKKGMAINSLQHSYILFI